MPAREAARIRRFHAAQGIAVVVRSSAAEAISDLSFYRNAAKHRHGNSPVARKTASAGCNAHSASCCRIPVTIWRWLQDARWVQAAVKMRRSNAYECKDENACIYPCEIAGFQEVSARFRSSLQSCSATGTPGPARPEAKRCIALRSGADLPVLAPQRPSNYLPLSGCRKLPFPEDLEMGRAGGEGEGGARRRPGRGQR